MWQRVFHLMLKEFLALLKDPASRAVLVLPPIVQTIIFGYAATLDLSHIRYGVYVEDRAAPARELLARFAGSPTFTGRVRLDSLEQGRALIDRGELLLVVHIGPRFSAQLLRHRPASVQVIVDGRNSNTAVIAQGYVREIVNRFNARWIAEHPGWQPPLAHLVIRAWFNPNLESRWFIIPGIIGLLLQVVAMLVAGLSIARERESGTFDQLLVTPVRPLEILLGKALPGFLVGLAEGTLIVLIAVLWFQVPLVGQLTVLYAGMALFLFATIGVGLAISALALTMQQGLLGAFLFMVPSVLLSGFATPIANMPVIVQYLTLLNPLRYFMEILRGVFLEDASLPLLMSQFWPLLVIGLANLAMAGWLFRHRLH
ncbi:MAG: ABC transporter permease [Nitrococcus mobilis]|nr:ABC transporter permease [Nitrococcus mobilis]